MFKVRLFEETDWAATRKIVGEEFRDGGTYPYGPDVGEREAHRIWIENPEATFVATSGSEVVGTYYLRANQPGLGDHVCNCGYIVSRDARRQGVATALFEHSESEAIARGFRAMQFNYVISSNSAAIALWESKGFRIVGSSPGAYRHPDLGFIDAHVMHKTFS